MRGKTADEVAKISNDMYQNFLTGGGGTTGYPQPQSAPQTGYQTQQPWQQPYQPPAPPSVPAMPTQDDWLNDPATAWERAMNHARTTQFDPVIQQQNANFAQLARSNAAITWRDEFSRWGPEIDMYVNQLPLEQRGPQAYEWIVNIVRGQHAREIQDEEINRRIEERLSAGQLMRPQPGQQPGTSPNAESGIDLDSDALPQWWRDECKAAGIKARDVDEFLMRTKFYGTDLVQARQKYMEALKRDGVVADDGVK